MLLASSLLTSAVCSQLLSRTITSPYIQAGFRLRLRLIDLDSSIDNYSSEVEQAFLSTSVTSSALSDDYYSGVR